MKRTVLLPIGIASATILVIMGLVILLTGSFYILPTITIDPVGDEGVDEYGVLVLTGTTNLGLNTHLIVNLSSVPGKGAPHNWTGFTSVEFGSGGRNFWRAVINPPTLPQGEYSVFVSDITFSRDGSTPIPGSVVATTIITLPEGKGVHSNGKESFLRINTVDTRGIGERIDISGTTSLPPGTVVVWKVETGSCPHTDMNERDPIPAGTLVAEGRTIVTHGIADVHRWSCFIDSSGLSPGCYLIEASGNMTKGSAEFIISREPTQGVPSRERIITIDTFPDPSLNTMVTLTGTTSLPGGEELYVAITPNMGSGYDFLVNPKDMSQSASFSGVIGTVLVEESAGEFNLWSMVFDTYRLHPGQYVVEVSIPTMNLTTTRREPGDVLAAMNFTILGGTP